MHGSCTAVVGEFLDLRGVSLLLGEHVDQCAHDVPHAVKLGLRCDMTHGSAAEHNVFLAREDLSNRFGFLTSRVPDLHGEDDGTPPRIVIEYGLDRRIGVNAPIPIGLSVDPDRRKCRRNGARSEHVIETDLLLSAIEISNLATANAPEKTARLAKRYYPARR